jgi:hypothetical protein
MTTTSTTKPEAWPDMHSVDELGYALAKQLPTIIALETAYGTLALDPLMKAQIEKALRPILERRHAKLLSAAEKARAGTVPCTACNGRGGLTNPNGLWEAYHRLPHGEVTRWLAEQGYASLADFKRAAGPFSIPCQACGGKGRVPAP